MTFHNAGSYAGDLLAGDAYSILKNDATSVLVDVRTQAEWSFVGVPDLSPLGKKAIFLEWQVYPSMQANPDFVGKLDAALRAAGAKPDDAVVFLCRSGARSRNAAIAMTSAGWKRCYNVSDGFEGGLDESRHRGAVEGWKMGGLPWAQS